MFQILSLDGGGIRGVFAAAFLTAIEEDLKVSITDHFDLIAGTSTGGIIAIGLGLGLTPRAILQFYMEDGRHIFRDPSGVRTLKHWIRTKHDATVLENSLKAILGDAPFGASTKRLIVPAFNLGLGDVYLFRTPHLEKLRRDFQVPAWKVAMATSAAPTFLPVSRHVDGLRLVDGGVWANNPSLVAIAEAVGQLGQSLEEVAVLNIGTLSAMRVYPKSLNRGGKVAWAQHAHQLILDAGSLGVQKQAALLLGQDRYCRLDAVAPESEVSLDDVDAVHDMVATARHHSRLLMPRLAPFMQHAAPKYTPLHGTQPDPGR